MKIFDLEKYGNTYKIQLNVTSYTEGNLAVTMTSWEDGEAEPWNVLTVNLNSIRPQNCAFIDTNNNGEDILAWIIWQSLPALMAAAVSAVIRNTGSVRRSFRRLTRMDMLPIFMTGKRGMPNENRIVPKKHAGDTLEER